MLLPVEPARAPEPRAGSLALRSPDELSQNWHAASPRSSASLPSTVKVLLAHPLLGRGDG